MNDWLGMGLLALGAGLAIAAVMKRRSRIRNPLPAGAIRPEFAAMGEIVRPLVLGAIALFTAKIAFYYFVMGGSEHLTKLEFGAMLFALAAYCSYLIIATTRPKIVEVEVAQDARSHA